MPEDRPSPAAGEKSILDRYTILVVDDDEALQFYLRTILGDQYSVLLSSTAPEALVCIHERDVDLVLLDLMLPGIPGTSLCRTIKERWRGRRIPVIVLTARTDLETKVETLEAGADDYITKPFHPQELLTRIKVQLRIRELQRELVKTERLKAIVETAVSANHEINNPLCALINNAELMLTLPSVKADPEATLLVQRILENSLRIEDTLRKMANLIQPAVIEYLQGVSMLDLAKSESKGGG